mgnify:CR=1 FL=1
MVIPKAFRLHPDQGMWPGHVSSLPTPRRHWHSVRHHPTVRLRTVARTARRHGSPQHHWCPPPLPGNRRYAAVHSRESPAMRRPCPYARSPWRAIDRTTTRPAMRQPQHPAYPQQTHTLPQYCGHRHRRHRHQRHHPAIASIVARSASLHARCMTISDDSRALRGTCGHPPAQSLEKRRIPQ